MISCQKCGNINEKTDIFCQSCGTEKNKQPTPSIRPTVHNRQSVTSQTTPMRCTFCGNEGSHNFFKDEGRLVNKWGFSHISLVMMTCNHCGHVEMFNTSRFNVTFD